MHPKQKTDCENCAKHMLMTWKEENWFFSEDEEEVYEAYDISIRSTAPSNITAVES